MKQQETHTVRTIAALLNERLATLYPREERTEITRILLEEITGMSRAEILACPLQPLSHKESQKILEALHRLEKSEPLQYILKKAWFYGLEFTVNQHTLIPRPETEELVFNALKIFANHPTLPKSFLDAGTGSGCIAITLIHENNELEGFAFDIHEKALEVATKNAEVLKTKILFAKDDMQNFMGAFLTKKVGILISNPPYVLPSEKTQMRLNVTNFEPDSALYAPEEDPLLFYKNLKHIAINHVVKGGFLLFEINEGLSLEMLELFSAPQFTDGEIIHDMRGKPRFFICKLI